MSQNTVVSFIKLDYPMSMMQYLTVLSLRKLDYPMFMMEHLPEHTVSLPA